VHTINRRGSSIEFAEYSDYHWGDDFRAIDWNLYGRLERLFIKTYKEDVELDVHILVDASASMSVPDRDQKWAYASTLALSLAYIGLANRNVVRVGVFGGRSSRRAAGLVTSAYQDRGALVTLRQQLATVTPHGSVTFEDWARRYLFETKARGGTAIVISDWMMEPESWHRALSHLRCQHIETKIIQVLGAVEHRPGRGWRQSVVVDAETGEQRLLSSGRWDWTTLLRALESHNEQLRTHCRNTGMTYAQVTTDTPIDQFILRELPRLGFVQ